MPKSTVVLLSLLVLTAGIVGFYLFKINQYGRSPDKLVLESAPSPSPEPLATPAPELPKGVHTYSFSHGKNVVGPLPKKLTVDPLSPAPGEKQSVTVTAAYDVPITGVKVMVLTDTKSAEFALKKSGGSVTNGSWSGTWTLDDTYDHQYGFRLILTSSKDTYDNTMWFRK